VPCSSLSVPFRAVRATWAVTLTEITRKRRRNLAVQAHMVAFGRNVIVAMGFGNTMTSR